ncbi:hypothetical protein NC652_035721 [Populus alba x Populus x berolinensis]|nr:hypothetical protein NC652_035721 [Populus alba x Populus x berolinensis]
MLKSDTYVPQRDLPKSSTSSSYTILNLQDHPIKSTPPHSQPRVATALSENRLLYPFQKPTRVHSSPAKHLYKKLLKAETDHKNIGFKSGLALESYLDSGRQGSVPGMAPSRVAGGLAQSSSSSGIFFQGDGQSKGLVNSRLSSSFGNSTNSITRNWRPILGPVSGDMNNVCGKLRTECGGEFFGDRCKFSTFWSPHLQRSASINTESYMRLPASPMSFSSNNISISGSSVVDGSSVVQQGNHQDRKFQQVLQNQQQQHGASSATSLPTSQIGGMSLPLGPRGQGSFLQDPNNLSQVQKKPRLDVKQEDILPQQVLQQLLQRQDSMQCKAEFHSYKTCFINRD